MENPNILQHISNSDIQIPVSSTLPTGPAVEVIHQHTLNRDKQTNRLIENASRPAVDIEINCNDENVNILHSPGFYTLVARPSLLNITAMI